MSVHPLLPPLVARALFWAAACACAIAHLAILRSVMRSAPRRRMEIAWAIVPALALAIVLVMTWRGMYANV